MLHLAVLLSLGCLASGGVINTLDVNDFHRSRVQGLNPGEELQIELQLHPDAEILLRGNATAAAYKDSALLLNLTINRNEGATLAIGDTVRKTELLLLEEKVEVRLSRKQGDTFRIIIDGNTFYEGSADFASLTRYVHVHGDVLVTRFSAQEATRLAVVNNVAKIDLDVGDVLSLGFSSTYVRLALLDNRDNQNLYLSTGSYFNLYKNAGKEYTDHEYFSYTPQSGSTAVIFANKPQGLQVFVNRAGYLWKHNYNAASTAYQRLYIDPAYLPYFQNNSITRKPKP
ncbi:unnamed protein product [Bursaphelenchus xylophilus]|uniref:(pine wood nematode) hypothetical protein n=1 Tax=Bursaphelenchus xylophilus TaxID=6326 RepID=A0A1I7S2Q1_BURXY|nr:unnamed protein product [Bursaphelenchus xylophilus]CAG9121737.1 unnamed protein product [Bursaphelenchus xylophilus]